MRFHPSIVLATSFVLVGAQFMSAVPVWAGADVNSGPIVQEAWVSQYNGACSYWEEVTDFALGDGCVYVIGFEYIDCFNRAFATVKYDYTGREQWVRNYLLGGTNGSAQANAVAVDGAGNVFVTGWSYEYVSGPPEEIIVDAATLKYDPDGNLLWVHRYRLPGHNNQPQDVVIDSAGNAYVAGAAWVNSGGDGGFDVFLLKYSPDGALLWDRTIGKSGERWDAGYAVALDPDENPVVAGYTQPLFCTLFCITYGYLVKYNSNGQLIWEREHESYNTASSWWRVAINKAGQIYAFGEIAPPGDLYHVWTSQYDSNGNLIWDRHYDGTASESNYAGGMALTPTGGIVVSGTSWDVDQNGGLTNIVTLRYEPDGTEIWRRLERAGYAHALGRDVAVDHLGRAYVTGYGFNKNNEEDMVTLCYTPEGDLIWNQIYADPNGGSDRSTAIAVDASSNVFVVGDAWVGLENYYDFTTIRYTGAHAAADINLDGIVNVGDLLAVINTWGTCANPNACAADIAPPGPPVGDDVVNVLDLLFVINNWG